MIRNDKTIVPTPEMLAALGAGHVAYVKPIMSEDAMRLYPQLGEIRPGLKLFTLNAADGTPIMISDSAESAVANAWEQELEPVSLH
ncbi:DUF1150 family protein [Labrys sp. La1]|uniref:BQ00720 family protein n=1 Tax=Labrys sp. La1 TaxID=3404917 RepID=UPI003EBC2A84